MHPMVGVGQGSQVGERSVILERSVGVGGNK